MVPKSKKREQNIKVIKMMMIVVLGFLCTFSPIAIFNTVVEKGKKLILHQKICAVKL